MAKKPTKKEAKKSAKTAKRKSDLKKANGGSQQTPSPKKNK